MEDAIFGQDAPDACKQELEVDDVMKRGMRRNHIISPLLDLDEVQIGLPEIQAQAVKLPNAASLFEQLRVDVRTGDDVVAAQVAGKIDLVAAVAASEAEDSERAVEMLEPLTD